MEVKVNMAEHQRLTEKESKQNGATIIYWVIAFIVFVPLWVISKHEFPPGATAGALRGFFATVYWFAIWAVVQKLKQGAGTRPKASVQQCQTKHMDQPSSRQEQVRQLQLLLATQLAHAATIAAVKAIEESEEINLQNLTPSVTEKEFLDIVVFCCFCMGMLGRYRALPARNYLLDSLFLFLGTIILRFRGIDAVREFEKVRASRLTRYMNQHNNLFGDQQDANGEKLADSLISDFETVVLKRPLPALKSVLREFIVAQETVAKREPEDLRLALQVDLGRNGDFASITTFLKSLTSLKNLSPGGDKFEHLEETTNIFGVYLQEKK